MVRVIVVCVVACLAALSAVDSKGAHFPAVILLDFSSLRNYASSGGWVVPRSLINLPDERGVFCTNNRFPDDIFCEVGVLLEKDFPDQYIFEVNITYPHASNPNTTCSVRLELDGSSTTSAHLSFSSFDCSPEDPEITKVPSFQMSDVERLTIRSRRYDNLNHICWHEFKNGNGIEVEASGKEEEDEAYEDPYVKFIHDGISCISAISFPGPKE